MNEIEIFLSAPHKKQREIEKQAKRFAVIACGRRFGKTQMATRKICEMAIEGKPVAWFAPTHKVLLEVFAECDRVLSPIIKRKNTVERRLELITGGVIEFWSMETDKPGESRKYAFVVIDEAGSCPHLQTQWENSIRPTLTDLKGKAWFIGTPKGLNYFYSLKQRADRGDEDWSFHHATSYDNPYLDPKEIDDAQRQLPSLVFSQEYMAEFVVGAGALLKREWLKIEDPQSFDNLEIAMGVDPAISLKTMADYTAIAIVAKDKNSDKYYILDVSRFRGSFQTIMNEIIRKAEQYKPERVIIENVSAQDWLAQELIRKTNLPVIAEHSTIDKVTRTISLRAKYERGLVYHTSKISNEYVDELLSFPLSDHDDMVDAVNYAYQNVSGDFKNSYGVMAI